MTSSHPAVPARRAPDLCWTSEEKGDCEVAFFASPVRTYHGHGLMHQTAARIEMRVPQSGVRVLAHDALSSRTLAAEQCIVYSVVLKMSEVKTAILTVHHRAIDRQ